MQGRRCTPPIAIVAYPRISNLDEFQPLLQVPGVRVVWARRQHRLRGGLGDFAGVAKPRRLTGNGCATRGWMLP